MNQKLVNRVVCHADQNLKTATDLVATLDALDLVSLTATLKSSIANIEDARRQGVQMDDTLELEGTLMSLGYILIMAKVGLEQAALAGLREMEGGTE